MNKTLAPKGALKRLRDQAPQRDHDTAALKHTPIPREPRTPVRKRWAETLPELRDRCGDWGDVAEVRARQSAIGAWLFNGDTSTLSEPPEVVSEAFELCREQHRARCGLPNIDGAPFDVPIIERISAESREEARRVMGVTVADWERAGKPYLSEALIQRTHQAIMASIEQLEKRA